MAYNCNNDEIYDYMGTKRCIPVDSEDGKRELRRQGRCVDRHPGSYTIDYRTGKCISDNEITALGALDKLQIFQIVTGKKCKKELKQRLHQCNCPICWAVASILSIYYSNAKKYFKPAYKILIKELYKIFTDFSKSNNTVCPRIPIEVIREYYRLNKLEVDANDMFTKGADPVYFTWAFLIGGVSENYSVGSEEITKVSGKFQIREPESKITVIFFDTYNERGASNTDNIVKYIINTIRRVVFEYYNKDTIIISGLITCKIRFTTGQTGLHSIAWRLCNGNLYLCNTHNNPCIKLVDDIELLSIGYLNNFIQKINYFTFIGEKL